MSNTGVIIGAVLIGFFAVPALAGGAPEIVNGLLLLLILGALLMNSSVWLPYLAQLGAAFSQPPPKPTSTTGARER